MLFLSCIIWQFYIQYYTTYLFIKTENKIVLLELSNLPTINFNSFVQFLSNSNLIIGSIAVNLKEESWY